MARLSTYETEVQLSPLTRGFFETLHLTSDPPMATHFRNITGNNPARVREADRAISVDPLLHALLRNTFAPVFLNAGFRGNVIPGSAEATINLRLLPGVDPHDVVRELQGVIADPQVEVRLANPQSGPSKTLPSSQFTELYRALEREAKVEFPGAAVTPYLFQAGTDAGAWRTRGVPVYGIYPYPIDAEDLTRMHGNDERVSVESLRQGTEMIYRTLVAVASK
jgi:acetylornithine deacetylase/succinyl-diaminopimelate desuccinylase-like protein